MTKSEAVEFFADVLNGRQYVSEKDITGGPETWETPISGQWATHDWDHLTRFVFACHDRSLKGVFGVRYDGKLMIRISPTGSNSNVSEHPSLKQAIDLWRKNHTAQTRWINFGSLNNGRCCYAQSSDYAACAKPFGHDGRHMTGVELGISPAKGSV